MNINKIKKKLKEDANLATELLKNSERMKISELREARNKVEESLKQQKAMICTNKPEMTKKDFSEMMIDLSQLMFTNVALGKKINNMILGRMNGEIEKKQDKKYVN